MTPEFLRRYYLLRIISNPGVYGVDKNGYVPLADVQKALDHLRSDNIDDPLYEKLNLYSAKTIKRDLEKIKSYYQVVIGYKRQYGYYIESYDHNEALRDVYEKTEIYLLHHHAHSWKSHVTTSSRSLSPLVDLVPLINAIEQSIYVKLTYQGWYDDDQFKIVEGQFHPLHLREINNAWYLIARGEDQKIYSFCLDKRIDHFMITQNKVKRPRPFDVKDYFKNSLGILRTGMSPEWIHIEVANHHFKYLTANPLHHSQVIIAPPKKECTILLDYRDPDIWGTIKVFLEPNYEFVMEMLRYNIWVRVVQPEHIKTSVKSHLERIMIYYP